MLNNRRSREYYALRFIHAGHATYVTRPKLTRKLKTVAGYCGVQSVDQLEWTERQLDPANLGRDTRPRVRNLLQCISTSHFPMPLR